MKSKTVLFIMPRLPFPAISGRKTSLYHYCRILSEELGYRLVVAAFLEEGDDPALMPSFIDRLIILDRPNAGTRLTNILIKSFILSKFPLQVSLFYDEAIKKRIEGIVAEEKPQIAIADMVRCTEYIKDLKCYTIADLDDRISIRYKRQFEMDIQNVNPYGALLNTFPSILKKFAMFFPIKKAVLKKEIFLLNKYEIAIGKKCNRTIFVAQNEADIFNKEIGENKAKVVSNGVDTEYFRAKLNNEPGNNIAFLGAMNVAHNENAALHFINDIFPTIKKSVKDAKFYVIGGGVSETLKKYAGKDIIFTGRVKDVREILRICKVFVCPMNFGSGIKTKNLEAMSFGMPVVTSVIGAENIDAIDGKDWFLALSNQEYAERVVELIKDDGLRKKIGDNARSYICSNFTWQVAKKQFEELLADVY